MKLLSNESGKNTTNLNGARLHEEKNETTPLPNENLNALQKWSNTQGNLQGGGGGGVLNRNLGSGVRPTQRNPDPVQDT